MLNGSNQMMQKVQMISNLLKNKNPNELYNQMLQTNPQFKKFVDENEGKTIEEIALAYDIDLDLIKKFM